MNGYHEKQHVLLQKILEKISTVEINSQRFDILKEKVSTSLNELARTRAQRARFKSLSTPRLLVFPLEICIAEVQAMTVV